MKSGHKYRNTLFKIKISHQTPLVRELSKKRTATHRETPRYLFDWIIMYHPDSDITNNHRDYNSNTMLTTSSDADWDRSQDKLFEQALVLYPDGVPDRWHKIASHLPGKSPNDVRAHYEALVHDVFQIDSGRVEIPNYVNNFSAWDSTPTAQISFSSKTRNSKHADPERKKGTPWTEHEHRLFLLGLRRFGKGDWRSISRNVVVTRTPTQVASHAQKYFLRHNKGGKKERKRSSIHDITTVDNGNDNDPRAVPVDQNWIPPPGDAVQQQPSAMQQQFHPQSQFSSQGGSEQYQNYCYQV